MPNFNDVVQALSLHGDELLKYQGVIGVRAGYRFANGWITDQPAIVVTVLKKLPAAQLNSADTLPVSIGGVPVDVAPATPAKQLLAQNRSAAAPGVVAPGLGGAAQVGDALLTASPDGSAVQVESAAGTGMPTVPYVSPPVPLLPVSGPFRITCCASPDCGWTTLSAFLTAVAGRLTVAMYEFTAPHIRDAIINNPGLAHFSLICDPGEDPLAAGDDEEPDLVCRLTKHFGPAMTFDWALTPPHQRVTRKAFKTSYHIKVAVADGATVWLSSGNWKSSNQPVTSPANPIPGDFWQDHDRDWHVVMNSPELAALFEAYIQNDMKLAALYQAQQPCAALPPSSAGMPDLFVPSAAPAAPQRSAPKTAAADPPRFMPAEITLRPEDSIQPVLTPDVDGYVNFVAALITGARSKLYFQNQYIKPGATGTNVDTLLTALAAKAADPNVDVRIILRNEPLEPEDDLRLMLEQLVHAGIPPARLRLQAGVHNKGIVVDSSQVLVSSQNWSTDGVQFNRDAGVVIASTQAAQYFEQIFEFDWNNYSRQFLPGEGQMATIATPGAPAPPGTTRMKWADKYRT